MKRSEMVAAICDHITQFMPDVELRLRMLIADCALAQAEKEGMQPPQISLPTKAILNNKEINVGNITTVRIWESEE